jgi:hypothetical protein
MGTVAGAIYDKQAVQSCSLAGITLMKGKLIELRQLQRSIDTNWREAEQARSSAELNNALLLSLKLVKASCDAMIGVLASAAGPQGKVVGAVYGGLDPFAKILGKGIAGDHIQAQEWAKAANAGASAAFAVASPNSPYADVVCLQKIKTDLLVDALAQDEKAVMKDLQSYGVKLTEMSLKFAGQQTWGRVVSVGKQLVGAGQQYAKAYAEWKQDDLNSTFDGVKRMAKAQHLQVQQQIDALITAISNCEAPIARA